MSIIKDPNFDPHLESKPTVFIGGIPKNVDVGVIEGYMTSICGNAQIKLITDTKDRLRGFAFAIFDTLPEVKQFLSKDHIYDGKLLDCKFSLGHEEHITSSLNNIRQPRKVFVDEIQQNITKKELMDAFRVYGEIEEIILIEKEKKDIKFAYVTYCEYSAAEKCVKDYKIIIQKCDSTPKNPLKEDNPRITSQVTAVYARPKFSKKMLQNISLPIKNYIKQIQKKSKKYDPKDFAMLEEEMKNFHLMGNGLAKDLSSKIKTEKKFLGKGAGSDFGDMKPGKLKEKIFPGCPSKNKNAKKPAKSQKHNNGHGGGNNPYGGQGQQGFPGMGQQPIQIICPQQNNFIYADKIMQQQIIIQNNQNIMFNQYPGYFMPNYGNQQMFQNQNQNFFPFNNQNNNNHNNGNNHHNNHHNSQNNSQNNNNNNNNSQTQNPKTPNGPGQDHPTTFPANTFGQNPHMQGFQAGSQFASTSTPQFTTTQTQIQTHSLNTDTLVSSTTSEKKISTVKTGTTKVT